MDAVVIYKTARGVERRNPSSVPARGRPASTLEGTYMGGRTYNALLPLVCINPHLLFGFRGCCVGGKDGRGCTVPVCLPADADAGGGGKS